MKDAFAAAAAGDGIALVPHAFDWLCEQGHVGLERVAKARRDPAIVAPVKAALEVLAAVYARLGGDVAVLHAARENLLLPVDLFHAESGTVIELDGAAHFTSFRLATLELYAPVGSTATRTGRCAANGPRRATACHAPSRPRGSASAASSASARTTTRCATSRRPRWGIRR